MRGLLDRLADNPLPEDSGRAPSALELRDMVSRDLESLLNTRSEAARLLPSTAFAECAASSLTYGIPDFSSFSALGVQDRDSIRRFLEQAVSRHEPRLKRARITLEPQDRYERVLRFRVDAMLQVGSGREKVRFDAVLQLSTQVYAVT